MSFVLHRFSACGNTFFICDINKNPSILVDQIQIEQRSRLARLWCSGFVGFRTDGLIFLSHILQGQKYVWDFYNRDGSKAVMCGNAARVVAQYLGVEHAHLETAIGLVQIGVGPNQMPYAMWELPSLSVLKNKHMEFEQKAYTFSVIDTGVPHALIEMAPHLPLARALRSCRLYFPEGMNVTFLKERAEGEVEAVTFERGVEDFTLSCGTGAVAAACWAWDRHPNVLCHHVMMPGGVLTVEFTPPHQVTLKGNVDFHFKLEVNE
ncbi:MAG: diaminopimelate epimerase [Bdellovibrionaceae bacterium]|nr:diaminopimelate epimerase [Pseudobdellovibrionaceae bacterium]MDW8189468.1 diaminopimelate epimerase [Pseudobdellovibrionaceae bacterium]